MKATVIFEDGVIIVDGDVVHLEPFSPADKNWRVIQWSGENGYIEVYEGERVWLSEPSILDPYLKAYSAITNALSVETILQQKT